MLDPIRVEVGHIPPFTCRGCNGTNDLADMHVEDFSGRLYICRQCASNLGRVFGIVDGDRMQELMSADRRLKQAERDLAERDAHVQDLDRKLVEADSRILELNEERVQLAGRLAQLEDTIRGKAQEELALVGSGGLRPVSNEVQGSTIPAEPWHPSTDERKWLTLDPETKLLTPKQEEPSDGSEENEDGGQEASGQPEAEGDEPEAGDDVPEDGAGVQ